MLDQPAAAEPAHDAPASAPTEPASPSKPKGKGSRILAAAYNGALFGACIATAGYFIVRSIIVVLLYLTGGLRGAPTWRLGEILLIAALGAIVGMVLKALAETLSKPRAPARERPTLPEMGPLPRADDDRRDRIHRIAQSRAVDDRRS